LVGSPPLGPFANLGKGALQSASFFGQLVFNAYGGFRHDDPGKNGLTLELPKPLGEHAIADVRDRAAQLRVPHAAMEQQLDHGTRPATPDELDRRVEARTQGALQSHVDIVTK